MSNRSTVHAHTNLVDGRSSAEVMAQTAFEKGFVSMGFTEHAPQDIPGHWEMKEELRPVYIAKVRKVAKEYQGRMRIHLGIERDALAHEDRSLYDYVLGSNHYLYEDGQVCAADGDPTALRVWRDTRYGGDGGAMVAEFFRLSGKYAEEYRPDVFAHFDLIKKTNKTGDLYNPEDPRVIDAGFQALEQILASGALLEVNTGGMARSGQPRPYPDPVYLKRWHEMGGRVIVGSDCHLATQIDAGFDMVDEYMRQAGFRTAWRLGSFGEDLFVEYPLD